MSISPASSEVGSCLNGTASINNTRGEQTKDLSNTKHKPNKTKGKSNRPRNIQVDRSDFDLDWRSSSGPASTKPRQEFIALTKKPLSADEDPNWRDHKPINEDESWNKTPKSRNSVNEGNKILFFIKYF